MTKVRQTPLKSEYPNHLIGCFDIGKKRQFTYAEAPNGEYIEVFDFANNIDGFKDCYNKLEGFRKQQGLSGILMGIESTGSYGEPLTEWLSKQGVKMVGVNSKHVHRFKEIVGNSPLKSDKKDPIVGTRVIQAGSYYEPLPSKGVAGELRELTKHRRRIMLKEDRVLNQLESQLARVFPELLSVMKSLRLTTTIELLEHYPLPDDIINLGLEELTKKIREISRKRLGKERALELMEAAKSSIGITECTTSISMIIKDLVTEYKFFEEQHKRVELDIKTLLIESSEATILMTHPGIGYITAAEIIGETGGLNNFTNAGKVLKLAGLKLYEKSSGIHKGIRRITKRGRHDLRRTLYLAGVRMIKKTGVYRKQFEEHIKTMKKPQAIIAIAKKLLRSLFSMVKNNKVFDASYAEIKK